MHGGDAPQRRRRGRVFAQVTHAADQYRDVAGCRSARGVLRGIAIRKYLHRLAGGPAEAAGAGGTQPAPCDAAGAGTPDEHAVGLVLARQITQGLEPPRERILGSRLLERCGQPGRPDDRQAARLGGGSDVAPKVGISAAGE